MKQINYKICRRYNRDHAREEIVCLTDNLKVANGLIEKGWKKRRVLSKIVLIAPEINLTDLFNPFEITEDGGFSSHLVFYNFIKKLEKSGELEKLIRKILDKEFFLINGKSVEFQTRIAFSEEENRTQIKERLKKICGFPLPKIKERKILVWKKQINKRNYTLLQKIYRNMANKLVYPESIYGFARIMPKANFYLLVPHSGFKFFDDFLERFGQNRILLYEKHFSQDGDFWIQKRNIKGKTVAIFDVSYSGRTLNWIANIVRKEGGKPIKIAVFPKSTLAVKSSDYIAVIDKIIKIKNIKIKRDWELGLYNQITKQ
jgi:hypothetical protein